MKNKYLIIVVSVIFLIFVLLYLNISLPNVGKVIDSWSSTWIILENTQEGDSTEIEETADMINERLGDSTVPFSEWEKETIIDFSLNKTDEEINTYIKEKWYDDFKNILTDEGKNVSETTEKIWLLYLCNVYMDEWKERFEEEFIDLIFPEEALDDLWKKETFEYFVNKCSINDAWVLKWFEEEAEFGCNVKALYYNSLIWNISAEELTTLLYSDDTAKKLITEMGEMYSYNFFKDILEWNEMSQKSCASYLE